VSTTPRVSLAMLPLEESTSALRRKNAALTEEIEQLRAERYLLQERLEEMRQVSHVAWETRRAALNLMEDAVEARRAERRENEERRRVEERLREHDRRKDEFLATLAHELRGPLAPAQNALNVLRLRGADDETLRVLGVIDRQVAHMSRLVEDLMEVSRITRGRVELRKTRIQLAAVLASAIETSRPLVAAAGHRLDVSMPPVPVWLDADPVRLAQVISNVLTNAAKYTHDGGQITVVATSDGSHARISVRDTGVGIPAHMLERVFELFTQAERGYDRVQGGLGIGLTLARSLLELHGGTIEAHSEGVDRGTEIVIELPLAIALDADASEPSSTAPSKRLARRMLVVDDNEDSADTLAMLLRGLGAEVRTANDGRAALELIRAHRPDIVLLDLGMPRMDGCEVARRARQMPEGRTVRLIALTGWGQDEDRERTRAAGFDDHLVKPVDLAALQALLADQ
jgi:signal transduction histidine kinase